MLLALFKTCRPIQWSKNLLVFAGAIFSLNIFYYDYFIRSLAAFVLFCMISSGSYIFNDLFDISTDRLHPQKSKRPIASGQISPVIAAVFAAVLVSGGSIGAFSLDREFGFLCLFYFIMIFAYSVKLKHVIILDSLIIALGFMIRAVAGTVIIDVDISKWLLVCTIFLSLFLALSKRFSELKMVNNNGNVTRRVLSEYSPDLLIQLISISASSAVIAYTLYTVDSATIEKFGTMRLVYTVPFVIYGIFRYMYLIHKTDMGESPELALLTDIPTLINILLYMASVFIILY